MNVLENNALLNYVEKNSTEFESLKTMSNKLNFKLENQIAWSIEKDGDMKKLIVRLFVVTEKDFDYKNVKRINEVKDIINETIEEFGDNKMVCIQKAQERLKVEFDLKEFLKI